MPSRENFEDEHWKKCNLTKKTNKEINLEAWAWIPIQVTWKIYFIFCSYKLLAPYCVLCSECFGHIGFFGP